MERRTCRENRQAARQAGLYKEQALPIITNEMLEDAFTKNTTVVRSRTDFADRLNGDGCMLFWEGKSGPTVTVHYKPELLPESARLAEKVDIAFFEVSNRLMFAIRAGKAYTPREAAFTKNIKCVRKQTIEVVQKFLQTGDKASLKLYGVQGGAALFEVNTEEG